MCVAYIPWVISVLVTVMMLSGCAVGPDFERPAAPDVGRYTREPLASRTSSADIKFGQSQHFVNGRDISADWWRVFRSRALNTLIEKALVKPQFAVDHGSAASRKGESVYAQQGKYFPLVQANFAPSRQQTPAALASPLTSADTVFNLLTAQVLVSYTFDTWGGNRRAVEALQGTADSQRFLVEAAYLTLTSSVVLAAVQEASLRAQIEATEKIIEANSKMLDILRKQFAEGYANRSDLAARKPRWHKRRRHCRRCARP